MPDPSTPSARPAGEITGLLRAWTAGDAEAGERVFKIIYPQLHRVVSRRISSDRAGDRLQTTDLLHETYLRLADQKRLTWNDRAHFFAIAATLVRRVVVDKVRHGRRQRRGAGARHVHLDDVELPIEVPLVDVVALDTALTELAAINLTAARVVDLRYFAGLSQEETADVLGIGRATGVRAWRFARSWLKQRLERGDERRGGASAPPRT
jgi:RNA polymerase sigma-70 factor, ECF subfamily